MVNDIDIEWLPLAVAAKHFGYSHTQSFTLRLRQLRERGLVADIGRPPADYPVSKTIPEGNIVILWANPKTALIHTDAPSHLFTPKRGRSTTLKLKDK